MLGRLHPSQRVVVGVGLYVALTGLAPITPLRDAVTLEPFSGGVLVRPWTYLIGAPLFGLQDTLTLLALPQHFAVLATLAAFYVSWRRRARAGDGSWRHRVMREVVLAGVALVTVGAFYLTGALLPRPMTGLRVDDPRAVVVDFHSHTGVSHDGRGGFDAEKNRAWHAAAGFHAAYITDHYTWRGYDDGHTANPATAGSGVVLLEGAELRIHRRPVVALGRRGGYVPALDSDSVYLDPERLRSEASTGEVAPTLIYTMPGALRFVVPATAAEPTGVVAIEIHDASPRGLEQTRNEREQIVALADSFDLALVGVSNLHGWGRTATAWSLVRIDGWQGMDPARLSREIEATLHSLRREAVDVVERVVPHHDGSPVRIALTAPLVLMSHGRALSWGERTSWMIWLLALGGVLGLRPNVAARRGR